MENVNLFVLLAQLFEAAALCLQAAYTPSTSSEQSSPVYAGSIQAFSWDDEDEDEDDEDDEDEDEIIGWDDEDEDEDDYEDEDEDDDF